MTPHRRHNVTVLGHCDVAVTSEFYMGIFAYEIPHLIILFRNGEMYMWTLSICYLKQKFKNFHVHLKEVFSFSLNKSFYTENFQCYSFRNT